MGACTSARGGVPTSRSARTSRRTGEPYSAGRTVTYALLADDVRQAIEADLRKLIEAEAPPVAFRAAAE